LKPGQLPGGALDGPFLGGLGLMAKRLKSVYSVEKLCFRRQFWSGEVAAKSIVLIRATKKWARKRP